MNEQKAEQRKMTLGELLATVLYGPAVGVGKAGPGPANPAVHQRMMKLDLQLARELATKTREMYRTLAVDYEAQFEETKALLASLKKAYSEEQQAQLGTWARDWTTPIGNGIQLLLWLKKWSGGHLSFEQTFAQLQAHLTNLTKVPVPEGPEVRATGHSAQQEHEEHVQQPAPINPNYVPYAVRGNVITDPVGNRFHIHCTPVDEETPLAHKLAAHLSATGFKS